MNWLLFWMAVYLLAVVLLALRHIGSSNPETYLVNNRQTRLLPLVFTTLATFVGGGTSIGLIAMGYLSGFAAVGIGIAYVVGFMLMLRYAGKIQETGVRDKIYSFPQYLIGRYHGQHNTTANPHAGAIFPALVSGVNIFIFFFLLAAQFVGMASLLKFGLGMGYQSAAIVSAAIVIVYTAISGLSGVIYTDMIQFVVILILIFFIFLPGIWADTNQLSKLAELPANMLNGSYYGWTFLIGLLLFLSPSVLVRMDIWQRMLAARNAATARKASFWSGIGMLPFYIIFPLVGMSVRLSVGDGLNANDVTYYFLEAHGSTFFMAFAVTALLAALMSSGDSFLNIIAISAVRDLRGSIQPQDAGLQKSQWKIRLMTLVFGIIALLMALWLPDIVDLMVVGIGTIVIFVPVTLLALQRSDVTRFRQPALWSVLSGFVINVLFFIWGLLAPQQFEPKSSFIPAFIVAAVVLIIGIKTKKTA
ncbi:MAG: sodium:solute symporter family protein [Bacteroidetes bacterium]|jgi:SSS family solute:Na+ symporter|nr:sodium:solute symporter family protein [Bacteroidota bacterium]